MFCQQNKSSRAAKLQEEEEESCQKQQLEYAVITKEEEEKKWVMKKNITPLDEYLDGWRMQMGKKIHLSLLKKRRPKTANNKMASIFRFGIRIAYVLQPLCLQLHLIRENSRENWPNILQLQSLRIRQSTDFMYFRIGNTPILSL